MEREIDPIGIPYVTKEKILRKGFHAMIKEMTRGIWSSIVTATRHSVFSTPT
jgi:hypothetical protein